VWDDVLSPLLLPPSGRDKQKMRHSLRVKDEKTKDTVRLSSHSIASIAVCLARYQNCREVPQQSR